MGLVYAFCSWQAAVGAAGTKVEPFVPCKGGKGWRREDSSAVVEVQFVDLRSFIYTSEALKCV